MKKQVPLLLFGAAIFILGSCKPRFIEVQPKIGPVTEAIFASGSIEPDDAYNLNSFYDGYLVKALVSEGDLVVDGQLLFQLDNSQQNTQVDKARATLEYSSANAGANSPQLGQLRAQVTAASAKRATDSITLMRLEALLATQSVSKQDADNARLNFQTSVSNHIAAINNLRASENKVRQDLLISKADLVNVAAGNSYYNLTAMGNSKVYQVFKKQGDLVKKGEQVAQLGNPDSIIIKLDIDEGSIGKIALGQQVFVELNTNKTKQYNARVSKIYPHFNETTQSYKVEAKFDDQIKGLISGTQLQANIVTNKKEKAMLIPHVFVVGDNKVVVKKEKGTDTVIITTGIVSDEWIEVLTGLSGAETLVRLK